ncbi:MAG: hypothetical protein RBT76_00755 [candidate division Zixibacteria bacterium]|jgi:hypothetical protein|nr:hypothetical protein [candidate division Zixibacteria bacterium]
MKEATVVLAAVFLFCSAAVSNEVPNVISYQGRLTDAGGNPLPDGPKGMRFIIYNDSTASAPANELWDSGPVTVTTTDGLFSVRLGAPPMNPLNLGIFGDGDFISDSLAFLGITVGADPEISPRTRLTTVPYAWQSVLSLQSQVTDFVTDDGVISSSIRDSAVTVDKLAPNAATAIGELAPSPGYALTVSTLPVALYGVTIQAPGPGYLRVTATGQSYLNADATSSSSLTVTYGLGLCDAPGTSSPANCGTTYESVFAQDADNASSNNPTHYFALSRTVDIPSAGYYTFWLNGNTNNAAYALGIWGYVVFSATFAPRELQMSVPLKLQEHQDDKVTYGIPESQMNETE